MSCKTRDFSEYCSVITVGNDVAGFQWILIHEANKVELYHIGDKAMSKHFLTVLLFDAGSYRKPPKFLVSGIWKYLFAAFRI